MQLPSEESHLRFVEKCMEDFSNEFKAKLVSSSLGLDHPTAPYFRQVEDGFGHTLQRQNDFLERMVTCKCSYTSSSSAYFPPPTHMGLKGDKHLMMSSIELPNETMKEIQLSEGENYKYEILVILKCLRLKHA